MKRSTDAGTVQYLSLNTLKKSPHNVRKTTHSKAHITALASLQKGPLAGAAEQQLKGTGWLPSLLQTQAA